MIANEAHYQATKAYLERFEQAATNLASRPRSRTKVEQLEFDAVQAKARTYVTRLTRTTSWSSNAKVSDAPRHKSLGAPDSESATIIAMNALTINEVPGLPTRQSPWPRSRR